MNNKQLNKEFSQVMNERNKNNTNFKKSGFTDSEEEEDETMTRCINLTDFFSKLSECFFISLLLSNEIAEIRSVNLVRTFLTSFC